MNSMQIEIELQTLLSGIIDVTPAMNVKVSGISLDSRRIQPGFVFIAVAGTVTSGSNFISAAINNGAAAILYDAETALSENPAVPVIAIPKLRYHAGIIADRFYDSPSSKLTIVGVTGTNGKTTCTQLLAQALNRAPHRCAVIGTLGNGFPDTLEKSSHTTPDVVLLHQLLAEFHQQGAQYVCIEVSSHALDQERVSGVAFDIAIFTNLSRDHLDYHGNMENYGTAKSKLFNLPSLKLAVINIDDTFGQTLLDSLKDSTSTSSYGFEYSDIQIVNVTTKREGLQLQFHTPLGALEFTSKLYGRFNAKNIAAITAVLLYCGFSKDELGGMLHDLQPIAGRAERFIGKADLPLVVIDYAHSPDALQHILQALREHTSGKIWCVFGCGGDRDQGKRALMGDIAERLADQVIVTDDNPRTESPQAIVEHILSGMKQHPQVVHDRRQAIRTAIDLAAAEDVVLVAGKGHEDYQQIGNKKIPFSDRETVQQLLGAAA